MKKLKLIFRTVSDWKDISAPGLYQYYLHITYDAKSYLIYLRWKYSDPWECQLIANASTQENMTSTTAIWKEIKINYYTEEELEHVKQNALSRINEYFKTVK